MKIFGALLMIVCFVSIIGAIANLLRFSVSLFGVNKKFDNKSFALFFLYFVFSTLIFLLIQSNLDFFGIEIVPIESG